MYCGPKSPEVGSTCRVTLKTRIRLSPNQYGSVDWPIEARSTPKESQILHQEMCTMAPGTTSTTGTALAEIWQGHGGRGMFHLD
jgi:hypothetical protein